jgi:hypothetical protein
MAVLVAITFVGVIWFVKSRKTQDPGPRTF